MSPGRARIASRWAEHVLAAMLLPNLVWRAGRVAEQVRLAAMLCVSPNPNPKPNPNPNPNPYPHPHPNPHPNPNPNPDPNQVAYVPDAEHNKSASKIDVQVDPHPYPHPTPDPNPNPPRSTCR